MKYSLLLLSLVFLLSLAAHNEHFEVVIPTEDGTNPWTHLDFRSDPDNFQFAIISDLTGGYRQGKPWQAFRLSIAVCDIDGEEDRGSQIWWKPFWRSDKNVIGSGTFVRE